MEHKLAIDDGVLASISLSSDTLENDEDQLHIQWTRQERRQRVSGQLAFSLTSKWISTGLVLLAKEHVDLGEHNHLEQGFFQPEVGQHNAWGQQS